MFASCSVQAVRSSTCTAEHASGKATATVQIESSLLSGSFYRTPARLCCVFFSSVLSSSQKKRKKFVLTTAVTAHVRTSAWPGEPTVSLLLLYVQCAIRPCLIFDSLRHNSRSTDIHCLFRAFFPRSAVVLVFVEQPAKSCFSIAR